MWPSLDSRSLDLAQAPATTVDLDTSLVLDLVSTTMDLGLATMDLSLDQALDTSPVLDLVPTTMDLALTQTMTLDLTQLLETLPDQVLVLATSLDLALTQITTMDLAQDLALGENI